MALALADEHDEVKDRAALGPIDCSCPLKLPPSAPLPQQQLLVALRSPQFRGSLDK